MQMVVANQGQTEHMQQNWVRLFLLCLGICLVALPGRAMPVSCPAYPANLSVSLGSGPPPGEPQVQSVNAAASLTGAGTAVLCTYTVQLTPVFIPTGLSPLNEIECPKEHLSLTILAPDNAPMAGFTPWAFGAPGTAEGATPRTSAIQTVTEAFSRVFFDLGGRRASYTSCKTINGGIFTFAIYSTIATGDTCTSSGGTVSCTAPPPPPCPASVQGSSLPVGAYNAATSQFGYIPADTLLFNPASGAPIEWPASMNQIKTAMGSSFNGASFALFCGAGGADAACEQGTPNSGAPGFSCVYDSPKFEFQGTAAQAQVTVSCSGSCGSL